MASPSMEAGRPEPILQAIERVRALPPTADESAKLVTVFGVVVDCSIPRPTRGSGEPRFALPAQGVLGAAAAGRVAASGTR